MLFPSFPTTIYLCSFELELTQALLRESPLVSSGYFEVVVTIDETAELLAAAAGVAVVVVVVVVFKAQQA